MYMLFLAIFLSFTAALVVYAIYLLCIAPRFNPLQTLAGPPARSWFRGHLSGVLEYVEPLFFEKNDLVDFSLFRSPVISPRVHEIYVQKYGRSIRIQGVGAVRFLLPFFVPPLTNKRQIIQWDQRLLTLDPLSVAHVLKNSTIYEKPWGSRRLITGLIGCGMLAAEGQVHKRQRRVATAAFSVQNMRALVPIVFKKGTELRDTWLDILGDTPSCKIDVCHWISRATFDVIGLAGSCLLLSPFIIALTELLFQGFDYNFEAIKGESNELFGAYKEMFEVVISQGHPIRTLLRIYAPFMCALLASFFFFFSRKFFLNRLLTGWKGG